MSYERLCREVEDNAGLKMQTPVDFSRLEERIFARLKGRVSASTLMRLWGYRKGVEPRPYTLDVLARFLGYADYPLFRAWVEENDGEPQSDEVVAQRIDTRELAVGDCLLLTWNPGRRCVVELRKDGRFEVPEAEVTKLSVGDTFECHLFIENQPLYLSQLYHEGRGPMVYVAGKKDGIHVEKMKIQK